MHSGLSYYHTFPWEDVRVTFLLQASMVLSLFFLVWLKKLVGSPFCMRLMKSALASWPAAFARSTSNSTSMGTREPDAREYSLSLSPIVNGLVKFFDSSNNTLNSFLALLNLSLSQFTMFSWPWAIGVIDKVSHFECLFIKLGACWGCPTPFLVCSKLTVQSSKSSWKDENDFMNDIFPTLQRI